MKRKVTKKKGREKKKRGGGGGGKGEEEKRRRKKRTWSTSVPKDKRILVRVRAGTLSQPIEVVTLELFVDNNVAS